MVPGYFSLDEINHVFSNVRRTVADSLQFAIYFEHGGGTPQIDSHWLMERQYFEALLLDLHLTHINLDFARGNFRRCIASTLDERLTSLRDHILNARRLVKNLPF